MWKIYWVLDLKRELSELGIQRDHREASVAYANCGEDILKFVDEGDQSRVIDINTIRWNKLGVFCCYHITTIGDTHAFAFVAISGGQRGLFLLSRDGFTWCNRNNLSFKRAVQTNMCLGDSNKDGVAVLEHV